VVSIWDHHFTYPKTVQSQPSNTRAEILAKCHIFPKQKKKKTLDARCLGEKKNPVNAPTQLEPKGVECKPQLHKLYTQLRWGLALPHSCPQKCA